MSVNTTNSEASTRSTPQSVDGNTLHIPKAKHVLLYSEFFKQECKAVEVLEHEDLRTKAMLF